MTPDPSESTPPATPALRVISPPSGGADGLAVVHDAGSPLPQAGPDPPVLLYLPGLMNQPYNTVRRTAKIFSRDLTRGPGTYTIQGVATPHASLEDGQRITDQAGRPVLDLYLVDYRSRLPEPSGAATGLKGLLARLAFQLQYFGRALVLTLKASNRAKSRVARVQLLLGFGAVVVLLLSIALTLLAIAAALGLYTGPRAAENLAQVLALGLTASTTWAITRLGPVIRDVATRVQLLLDYAQDDRHAATVSSVLDDALDALLEARPGRRVSIFGYSMGALVALDYVCPRRSTSPRAFDERLRGSLLRLVTVGCPLDFVRLFDPGYPLDRASRVPGLVWTNIFNAADVLGSNLVDGDDDAVVPDDVSAAAVMGELRPSRNFRYTDETLTFSNVWNPRGFLAHTGYWDDEDAASCLGIVWESIVTGVPAERNTGE